MEVEWECKGVGYKRCVGLLKVSRFGFGVSIGVGLNWNESF